MASRLPYGGHASVNGKMARAISLGRTRRDRGASSSPRWRLSVVSYSRRAVPRRNGKLVRWYGTSTDIEDRKQAEEKLRQDERELRQLIDFLPQHVLVLDAEGTLVQANQTTLDFNGHTLGEMRDAGTRERIKRDLHPDDVDRVANERRSGISKGVPFEIEKRVLDGDGRFQIGRAS